MNISVPDSMRDYVQDRIENGQYASVSDYVRELIRRDQTMIENEAHSLAALDASLVETVREMAAGGGVDLDAACDGLLAELRATGG